MARFPRRRIYAASAVLLAAGAAAVSVRGATPVAATRPTSAPATPPSTAPAPKAAANRPTTQVSLSFKDAPLDTVLDYLSEAAGFVIVKESPVEGRVTLVSRQAINADEAVMVLNTVLKSNGYAVIQQGRVLKIVAREKAKKLGTPVHFGADPAAIEVTDELITQVIPVTNIDAVKLKQDLSPMLGPDADVTANGGSNAIVVTDTSSSVKRMVEMIAALDQHESASFELRRYTLKNANAGAATKLISAIFKPDEAKAGKGAAAAAAAGGAEPAMHGKINAVADERTNTIFVTAAAESLAIVDGILKELDANPASVSSIKIFPLKYADATAAVKLVTAVFKPEAQPINPALPPPPPRPGDVATNVHINAAADERTNSVVVAASTETLMAVEDILKRLDSDPSSISEMKIVPLLNADATATAKLVMSVFKPDDGKAFNPFIPQLPKAPGSDTNAVRVNAVADDRTNSVVVTAPTDTLKAILDILKLLDANPASSANIKVFQLKYADAASAVKLIMTIFKPEETGNINNSGTLVLPRVMGMSEQAAKIKITAASDDRTNTLVVSGPGETIKVIEGIIKELDSNPAADQTIFIYRLKNGQAYNLEPILNTVFGNPSTSSSSSQRPQQANRNSPQANGLSGGGISGSSSGLTGGGRSGNGLGQSSFGSSSSSANSGRTGTSAAPPSLSANAARTANELAGQVSIVAEPDTNALIVTTAVKYLDRVKKVIDELDRPVPQVLIKVLIAEVSHDNSEDLGVDFSVLNQRANGNGQKFGTGFGTAAATGGLVVSFLEDNVSVTLRALATAGKLDVLSRPYILASDNQLASITVGQEVPFIVDSRITDLGQTINTIQYQDIGIILNVTPHINNEGLVILDVAPEISQLTGTSVPISPNVNAPIFAKRSAQSRVGIRDGQTIVIGGLMEDRKTSTVNKIPFLGDLPLIGALFRRTQIDKTKTELLIFLTPHVAQQPDTLKPMSADELKGTQLTPRAVAPGVFEEHLRGMERGGGIAPATQPATQPSLAPLSQPLPLPASP